MPSPKPSPDGRGDRPDTITHPETLVSIPERLRADLKIAMANRDRLEMSQLRTLIAAIENAEAVEMRTSIEPKLGVNHDVARRDLGPDDVRSVITRELDELADAVSRYRDLGLDHEVEELETRVQIVNRYLD